MIITVTGTSTIDGSMSANGENSGSVSTGSGGSIFLTTGAIAGTGTIEANGGNSINRGGGGGRVSLILTGVGEDFTGFTGTMTAYGGDSSATNATKRDGAAGTIYQELQSQASGTGTLTIDNNNLDSPSTEIAVILSNDRGKII